MRSAESLESHRKAAEALAHLSASADSSEEKVENNSDTLQKNVKINIDSCAAERFPKTLWKVLSDENNASVIAWLPNGRGFSVYNRKKLISEVLPRYFKTKKYASFTRRLNRWGFGCFTKGQGTYVFHHPMFLRDHPELSLYMACSKKINDSKRSNPGEAFMSAPKHSLQHRILSPPELSSPNQFSHNKLNGSKSISSLRSITPIQSRSSAMQAILPFSSRVPSPLMNAYVASNDFFPELSSSRTKAIISNALRVLNRSDLKCLEILQIINLTQYNQACLKNPRIPNSTSHESLGIRAYAA